MIDWICQVNGKVSRFLHPNIDSEISEDEFFLIPYGFFFSTEKSVNPLYEFSRASRPPICVLYCRLVCCFAKLAD